MGILLIIITVISTLIYLFSFINNPCRIHLIYLIIFFVTFIIMCCLPDYIYKDYLGTSKEYICVAEFFMPLAITNISFLIQRIIVLRKDVWEIITDIWNEQL